MEELIKRLERVIATGATDKDGQHPISAETVLEVVKQLSEHSTNLAEVGTDCISRQAAIDALCHVDEYNGRSIEAIRQLPSAQQEPLTDKEQRIFLAAMARERKVCKEVDDQYVHEPYEVSLTKVCDEIKRKVKKVLWT